MPTRNNPVKSYRDLVVWQRGMELVIQVYRSTRLFPKEEQYGLTSQICRAAVSVPSNIAEGHGRGSTGEFKQFLHISRASLYELQTQLEIAKRLDLIGQQEAIDLIRKSDEIGMMLNGLLARLNIRIQASLAPNP